MTEPDTSARPRLLSATEGEVSAESNMFRLYGVGALLDFDEDDPLPVPGEDLVATASGVAVFGSALSDHYPHVTVEYWSAEPPPPDGDWQDSARTHLAVASGRMTLASGVSNLPGPHQLRVEPGDYVLATWCTGRDEARERIAAGEWLPHGVERWLVRMWQGGRARKR